jgi:uncharacterized protein YndB with AHSA1/START domain
MSHVHSAQKSTVYRIELFRNIAVSSADLWEAISQETEVAKWMKFPAKVGSAVGQPVFVDFTPDEPLSGTIYVYDAGRTLGYTWGDSLVKWEIEETEGGTNLRLTHIGVQPEYLIGLTAGWHAFFDQLEIHLTGVTHSDRFAELTEQYRLQFA